jgi:uncharacterized protein YndB with AHSA1/START domain
LQAYTTIVDKLELRSGGAWRFVQSRADGSAEGFRGEFREIVAPEYFTWTFAWEDAPGHMGLETYRFEEHGGQTTLTATSFFNSQAERDGVIASLFHLIGHVGYHNAPFEQQGQAEPHCGLGMQ